MTPTEHHEVVANLLKRYFDNEKDLSDLLKTAHELSQSLRNIAEAIEHGQFNESLFVLVKPGRTIEEELKHLTSQIKYAHSEKQNMEGSLNKAGYGHVIHSSP